MKKVLCFNMILVLLGLCGCTEQSKNSDTQFLFDTVVTLTADCDREILNGAFSLCRDYEQMLSRTVAESDVSKINSASAAVTVSRHTATIVKKALYYSEISGGRFDITICPVSLLWDFENGIVPSRDEIAAALKNVDYHSLDVSESTVSSNGAMIDLGGIAKGYIADRLVDYFKENGVKRGIVDLGGNISVFGEDGYIIGIRKPFSSELAARVSVKNMSVVTSGIYQRYIEDNGKIYHHILDPETGYGADTDLLSATVICKDSIDADALATVCMLLGKSEALKLVENTSGTQAVFIDNNYNISYTSGLFLEGDLFYLK